MANGDIQNLAAKTGIYQQLDNRNTSEHWDKLAKPFSCFERVCNYACEFMNIAQFDPNQTVLDVGCGSGTLAIPLSDLGIHVTGIDFSPAMLKSVQDVIDKEAIENIKLMNVAWEDDWEAAGVPVCDVAVSSRSIMWTNIEECIHKLDDYARYRVCVTVPASSSMFHQAKLERALGRALDDPLTELKRVIDECLNMGRQPQVSYIRSLRYDIYDSPQQVQEHLLARIGGLQVGEQEAFNDYCSQHVVRYTSNTGELGGWFCDEDLLSSWAFVSWEKNPELSVRHTEMKYH